MEKINVAELLKDCPKGMELDCVLYENVTFDIVQDGNAFPIKLDTPEGRTSLSKYGCSSLNPQCKCVIFPKGKTSWEGFHRPFKDGDILTNDRGSICIYKGPMYYNKNLIDFYCGYRITDSAFLLKHFGDKHFGDINECHFATEEEKAKLFQIIKDNGYKWNAETRTLEKLVPNKFDITALIPFESRVLVRNDEYDKWLPVVWGFYDKDEEWPYNCSGFYYAQCIPYEENKHLLGKTDDCENFYKTWES